MKVIIAGSRIITNPKLVYAAIERSGWKSKITEVVCGCARGVDILGEKWAQAQGIKVKLFPAEWNRYGRGAGSIRNGEMAEYGHALIAVMVPGSRGTANMVKQMKGLGKPTKVYIYRPKKKSG